MALFFFLRPPLPFNCFLGFQDRYLGVSLQLLFLLVLLRLILGSIELKVLVFSLILLVKGIVRVNLLIVLILDLVNVVLVVVDLVQVLLTATGTLRLVLVLERKDVGERLDVLVGFGS